MNVWAIRHKPTGAWMPARMSRSSTGGWSYWIPGSALDGWSGCDGYDKNPRLFFTLQSVRNALTAWLRGIHHRHQGTSYDFEGMPDGYDEMSVKTPPIERKRDDMEIVPFELKELSA